MATSKEYAYYLKGNKVAIVERDYNDASGLTSPSLSPAIDLPNSYAKWKSPVNAVEDGLEIEYTYSPTYRITDISKIDTNITAYRSNDGYLEIGDATSAYTNYGNLSGYNITDGSYIVLRDAGRWNGLHKTITKTNLNGTNDTIKLETRYNGSSSWSNFEEVVSLYYYINTLNDESDEIDLPEYLSRALVYYVKAKLAEDIGEIELKEYFLKEFRVMVGKNENAKVWAARKVSSGSHAIR